MKLAALFTGGKDSTYAIHLAKQSGHEITGLITLKSKNDYSYMFHTPAIELTELQAESMNLPISFSETAGEKEKELIDLENAIKKAKDQFEFEGIITGALFSEYQSSRIQAIADKLNLKVVNPLWHKNQEDEMQELLDNEFEFILTAIAGEGFKGEWLGKVVDQKMFDELKALNLKIGINVAFEGGEAESLVLDCPLFIKKLVLEQTEIIEENENTARLIIKKAKLE